MSKIFNFTVDKDKLLVTIERSFDAPVDMVWRAWTDPELLAQWWAPKPWKAVTKDMDFREGGRWLYAMTGPEGQKAWDLKTFLKIDPKKSFSYRSTFSDENGDLAPGTTGSTWTNSFTERDGVTIVTNVIVNESLERLEKQIEMGFKEGYTMGLNQLEELLASLRK
ncbi:MAG TPA: SRPBCC domain-containing protein [Fibrobacteria bacterium]|nr:SRPBCC domain-containing protein [Fibrobacteria bacterium]